jgi:hypothetical protein
MSAADHQFLRGVTEDQRHNRHIAEMEGRYVSLPCIRTVPWVLIALWY